MPVRGEKAAGCWSLVPSAAGQMFWTFLSSPPCRVENSRTTCGRPVSMSTLRRPVHRRVVLLRDQQPAVLAVQRVGEAVAVEVDQRLVHPLAADREVVHEDHLVDAVVVPLVMRRHLVDPAGHAGVGVAREDGHRPLVVAGPLRRVPGAGIAGAVIDQVQVGVVGEPAPGGAAAQPPLVALPALDRAVRRRPAGPYAWCFCGSNLMSSSVPTE